MPVIAHHIVTAAGADAGVVTVTIRRYPDSFTADAAAETTYPAQVVTGADGRLSVELPGEGSYATDGYYVLSYPEGSRLISHVLQVPDSGGPYNLGALVTELPATGTTLPVPLSGLRDTGTLAAAVVGDVPVWDGARWAPSSGGVVTSDNDPGPLEGMTVYAYGHSYNMPGQNTDADAGGPWVTRLARRKHMTLVNRAGAGGLMIAAGDCVIRRALAGAGAWVPNTRGLVTLCGTVNDVAAYGTDPAAVRSYEHSLRAFLAATRAKTRVAAATSAWVYSPGWSSSATSAILSTNRFQTTAPGSYAEVNITGSACDLLLTLRAAGNGVYTVTSDGVTVATVASMDTTMGVDYTPAVIPLSGLGPGTHTIRITLTSGAWLGVDALFIPSETPPPVAVVSEGDVTAAGHESLAGTWRPVVASVTAEFPHAVHVAPTGWVAATMLREDGLHPNDWGASFYATRTLDELADQAWTNGLDLLTTSPTYTIPTPPDVPPGGQSGTGGGGSTLPPVGSGTLFADFDASALALADGAPVTAWASSGGTIAGGLANVGTAPTFQTGELNGQPAVRFDGTGYLATTTDDSVSQPFTRFLVARFAAGQPAAMQCLIDSDVAGAWTNVFTQTITYGLYLGSATVTSDTGTPVVFTAPHIIEVIGNNPAAQVGVNGVQGIAGFAGTNAQQGVRIGSDNSGGGAYIGDVFEVVIYAGELNSTDRTTIRQYLATKYAITLP